MQSRENESRFHYLCLEVVCFDGDKLVCLEVNTVLRFRLIQYVLGIFSGLQKIRKYLKRNNGSDASLKVENFLCQIKKREANFLHKYPNTRQHQIHLS